MKTRSMLAGIVAVLAMTVATTPAQAAGPRPISHCSRSNHYGVGRTISKNSYLTKSLSCRKGFVLAHGATLDLRGHTLKGRPDPKSCVGCPGTPVQDQPGHAGIILADGHLVNGRLTGWESGVRVVADSPTSARARSVVGVTFTANDAGLYAFDNTDTLRISTSRFTRNGLGVQGVNGGGLRIVDSTFSANRDSGLEMANSGGLSVRDSVFTGNAGSGIYVIDGTGVGAISGNIFVRNAQYGLLIGTGEQTVTAGNNLAAFNHLNGLYVSDDNTIIDAGGNMALGNGESEQCVGLTCS